MYTAYLAIQSYLAFPSIFHHQKCVLNIFHPPQCFLMSTQNHWQRFAVTDYQYVHGIFLLFPAEAAMDTLNWCLELVKSGMWTKNLRLNLDRTDVFLARRFWMGLHFLQVYNFASGCSG